MNEHERGLESMRVGLDGEDPVSAAVLRHGRRAARRGDDVVSVALLEQVAENGGCSAVDALCCMTERHIARGDTRAASDVLDSATRRATICGHPPCVTRARLTHANLATANGDLATARALLQEEVWGSLRGRWLLARGRLTAAYGLVDEAAWLYERAVVDGQPTGHAYDEARVRRAVTSAMCHEATLALHNLECLRVELSREEKHDLLALVCAAEAMAYAEARIAPGYQEAMRELVLALEREPRVDPELTRCLERAAAHWRASGEPERASIAERVLTTVRRT